MGGAGGHGGHEEAKSVTAGLAAGAGFHVFESYMRRSRQSGFQPWSWCSSRRCTRCREWQRVCSMPSKVQVARRALPSTPVMAAIPSRERGGPAGLRRLERRSGTQRYRLATIWGSFSSYSERRVRSARAHSPSCPRAWTGGVVRKRVFVSSS